MTKVLRRLAAGTIGAAAIVGVAVMPASAEEPDYVCFGWFSYHCFDRDWQPVTPPVLTPPVVTPPVVVTPVPPPITEPPVYVEPGDTLPYCDDDGGRICTQIR